MGQCLAKAQANEQFQKAEPKIREKLPGVMQKVDQKTEGYEQQHLSPGVKGVVDKGEAMAEQRLGGGMGGGGMGGGGMGGGGMGGGGMTGGGAGGMGAGNMGAGMGGDQAAGRL